MRASWAILLVLVPLAGDAEPKRDAPDLRAALAAQVAAEQASAATAIDTVAHKLAAADAARAHRVAAALRLLDGPADARDPFARARREAAARYLLARDQHERGLLADELDQLHRADHDLADAALAVPNVLLPAALGWPADGAIARHFGDYQHERSKAQLSRRGVDLDVADHAPAVAPADGVVRYAGPIRGLDRGIVLDHGSYFTVIAKLGDIIVPEGAQVARGDRLGRAARHRVYFEVRAKIGPGGLPIDPEPLLRPR